MVKITFRRKTLSITAKKLSLFGMVAGLMFRSKKTQNLLFEFSNPKQSAIHSFFVFFDFLAIWLDEKNNVIQIDHVKPFTCLVKPKKPAQRLIEIPYIAKNKKIIEFFVDKGKV